MSAKHDPTSPTDRLHSQGCGKCLFCLRILAKCECTAEDKVRCSEKKNIQIMKYYITLHYNSTCQLDTPYLNPNLILKIFL